MDFRLVKVSVYPGGAGTAVPPAGAVVVLVLLLVRVVSVVAVVVVLRVASVVPGLVARIVPGVVSDGVRLSVLLPQPGVSSVFELVLSQQLRG